MVLRPLTENTSPARPPGLNGLEPPPVSTDVKHVLDSPLHNTTTDKLNKSKRHTHHCVVCQQLCSKHHNSQLPARCILQTNRGQEVHFIYRPRMGNWETLYDGTVLLNPSQPSRMTRQEQSHFSFQISIQIL